MSSEDRNINDIYEYAKDRSGSVLRKSDHNLIGSGFFISSDGIFVTCNHLKLDNNNFYILDGNKIESYEIIKIFPYPSTDTLIITTNRIGKKFFQVNTSYNLLGRDIFAFGFPDINHWRNGYGKVSTIVSHGDLNDGIVSTKVFGIESRTIFPGMSGGPIVDLEKKEVIGLIHGYDKALEKKIYNINQFLTGLSSERYDDLIIPFEEILNHIPNEQIKSMVINYKPSNFDFVSKIKNILELLGFSTSLIKDESSTTYDIKGIINYRFMEVSILIICLPTNKEQISDLKLIKKIRNCKANSTSDKICIVYANKPPNNLIEIATLENITILSESDFLNDILDFSNYLKYHIQEWEESDFYIKNHYINLNFKLLENNKWTTHTDVFSKIEKWIQDKNKNKLLIIGKFGSGKSLLCKKLMYIFSTLYIKNTKSNRIPILLKLKDTKHSTFRELVTDLLVNKFKVISSNFGIFKNLNSEGKLLLILDGFDEMSQSQGINNSIINIKSISDCFSEKSKAIITCRSEYFIEKDDIENIFQSHDFTGIYNKDGMLVIYIDDFNDDQINNYANSRFKPNEAYQILTYINQNKKIMELSKRPILLDMITSTFPEIKNISNITLPDIYKKFVNIKITNDEKHKRTFLHKNEIIKIMEEVSIFMSNSRTINISFDDLLSIISSTFPYDSRRDIECYSYDIILNSFLITCSKPRTFEFSHKSFYEYFLASRFVSEIKTLINKSDHNQYSFGMQKFNPEVFEFMIGLGISENDLWGLIYYTKGKNFNETRYLGGNCISALRTLSTDFSFKNFDHTILVEANFSNCNLIGSSFIQADLRNGNYNNCNLKDANMKGADLTLCNIKSIKIIEMIYYNKHLHELYIASTNNYISIISFNFDLTKYEKQKLFAHSDYIFKIASNDKNSIIATGSRDLTIKVWDIHKRIQLQELKGHYGNIRGLSFYSDEIILSCGSDGKIIKWTITNNYSDEILITDADFHGISINIEKTKFVVGDLNGKLRIFDYHSFSLIKDLHLCSGHIKDVTYWGDNSEYIIATSQDGSLIILKEETLEFQKKQTLNGAIKCLSSNANLKILATGNENGSICIWNGLNFLLEEKFHAHNEFVTSLAFNNEGTILYSAGSDGFLHIWDISNLSAIKKISSIEEDFLKDKFNCNGLILSESKGLSTYRIKHLGSSGAITDQQEY